MAESPRADVDLAALQAERDALQVELTQARAEQAATAGVLAAIRPSLTDLQTVLDTITENAARLSGAGRAVVTLFDGKE